MATMTTYSTSQSNKCSYIDLEVTRNTGRVDGISEVNVLNKLYEKNVVKKFF